LRRLIKTQLNKLSFIHSKFNNWDIEKLKKNLVFFSLLNLLWVLFRTGTKPTRVTYPCQKAALSNISFSLSALIPLSISSTIFTIKKPVFSKNGVIILSILVLGIMSGELLLRRQAPNPYQVVQLKIESKTAVASPDSDIFVVNGETTPKIIDLISLMSSQNLFFYKSGTEGSHKGNDGLIARDDVIILKINSQWPKRGGTNTDILKDLIDTIVNHPDGFVGEIIVADNGQGYGRMNHAYNNAENTSQSTQDVVDIFSTSYNVSTYDWTDMRDHEVIEYSAGEYMDGYVLYESADPETGIYVSYPKFRTKFGTYVSFKHGVWNGTSYEKNLKVINLPVLKSHSNYGVTGCLKNYMGVQTEIVNGGLANGHTSIATGGMGTLFVEYGLPTLNIMDAIWVNANPFPDLYCGPLTEYEAATRVNILLAGIDPVAIDYWASKYILVQTATTIGYDDTHPLDPENTKRSGLTEAFGTWLDLTEKEMKRSDLNITSDEGCMNIITDSPSITFSSTDKNTSGFELTMITFIGILVLGFSASRKRKIKS
jgi:hypothetical protein